MPQPLSLRLAGTGIALPRQMRPSSWFDDRYGKPAGWTARHAGLQCRPLAGRDDRASVLGARAAEQALAAAGWQASELDLVISACGVGEQALPGTATLLHRELGLDALGTAALDINSACLSFVSALDLVACALAAGRYRRVLVVASEIPSAGLDWDDPDSAPLFGDGAAAVAVEAGDGRSRLLAAHHATWSSGLALCQVRAGGTGVRLDEGSEAYAKAARFAMDGPGTYRLAAQKLPGFVAELTARAGLHPGQLDLLVPHQASAKALTHMRRALRLPAGMVVDIIEGHGNQMAASIPTALHLAIADGRLQRGQTVALVGTGAGLAAAGLVLRY